MGGGEWWNEFGMWTKGERWHCCWGKRVEGVCNRVTEEL